MKKVVIVDAMRKTTLEERINQTLAKNPTAELVSVVWFKNQYCAFIQYESYES